MLWMNNVGLFEFWYYVMLAIAIETIKSYKNIVSHDPSTCKSCEPTTSI